MREEIKEIIKQVLQIEQVKDNISRENCEKWDSLNHLNLIVALEIKYDESFEPDEIVEMRSLEDIVQMLTAKKG